MTMAMRPPRIAPREEGGGARQRRGLASPHPGVPALFGIGKPCPCALRLVGHVADHCFVGIKDDCPQSRCVPRGLGSHAARGAAIALLENGRVSAAPTHLMLSGSMAAAGDAAGAPAAGGAIGAAERQLAKSTTTRTPSAYRFMGMRSADT